MNGLVAVKGSCSLESGCVAVMKRTTRRGGARLKLKLCVGGRKEGAGCQTEKRQDAHSRAHVKNRYLFTSHENIY